MKMILIHIGIILVLSSCNGCLKIRKDVRVILSTKFNECRCQWYSFVNIKADSKPIACQDFYEPIRQSNIENCKKETYSKKYPKRCKVLPNIEYCNNLVGFSAQSWASNITPKAKESKRCFQDSCSNE